MQARQTCRYMHLQKRRALRPHLLRYTRPAALFLPAEWRSCRPFRLFSWPTALACPNCAALINPTLGANSGHIQADSIKPGFRTKIQCFAIVVTPGKVMRMFWSNNRPQMFASGRDNPKPARSGYIQIPPLIDLHAVKRVLAGGACHVEENFTVGQRPICIDFVSHDDLFLLVPVIHIKVFLVRGECQTVRSI